MKRIFFLIVFLIVSTQAFGQLNIQKRYYAEKVLGLVSEQKDLLNKEQITRTYITRQGTTYYLCRENYIHDNRSNIDIPVDRTQYAFCLGKTKSASIKTAEDIDYIYTNYESGSSAVIIDASNQRAVIRNESLYSENGRLYIDSDNLNANKCVRIRIGNDVHSAIYAFTLEKKDIQKMILIIKQN